MSANFEVKVVDNSDKVIKATNEQIEAALEAIGLQCEGYAQLDCPVDTGLLRNSITHAVAGNPPAKQSYSATSPRAGQKSSGHYSGSVGSKSEKAVYIGTNVEYATAVEYKDISHRVGKAHFLRDAATTHNSEYKQIAEHYLSS